MTLSGPVSQYSCTMNCLFKTSYRFHVLLLAVAARRSYLGVGSGIFANSYHILSPFNCSIVSMRYACPTRWSFWKDFASTFPSLVRYNLASEMLYSPWNGLRSSGSSIVSIDDISFSVEDVIIEKSLSFSSPLRSPSVATSGYSSGTNVISCYSTAASASVSESSSIAHRMDRIG